MNLTLDGVLAFPATPMDNAGDRLDLNAYESLLGWIGEGGVHGIIPLGSTASLPTSTRTSDARSPRRR
ncbi:hypothetical protein [Saccharopolyspora sp. ASAGF58]|uniref:hypothetical protein n=1 Tax=Saccharopolyspora sp. ASAGF58 TaxID=2719023 RepID=UPI001FF0C991|nr:hypothetical protein [Saccharopolyspora sp. ASAGF58]